jgi:MFS family permease
LIGTVGAVALTILIGFISGMQGMGGFWVLLAIGLVQPVFSNMGQAASQAIIPDLVPDEKRGRFSGVKALLEIPLPLILVAFTVGKLISQGNLWGALLVAVGVLVISMLLTMLIPEEPLKDAPASIDWKPFVRLVAMTLAFAAVIYGTGMAVKLVSNLLTGISSPTALFIIVGLYGVLGMLLAVALGVWLSIRIGLGETATRNSSFTWWVINRLAFLVGAVNLSTFAIYFLQARLGYVREAAAAPASKLILFVDCLFWSRRCRPAGSLTASGRSAWC